MEGGNPQNLEKLEYCVVGSWNPRSGNIEDLEKLGKFLASSWGLKGRLGLAKLERNRILLEFESLDEAQRAFLSGERTMGGLRLRFEKWSPRTGCREEEEQSNEVWVRIYGLPVSLWNPTVLRRVGMNVVASLPSIRRRRSWKSSNGLGFWLRWMAKQSQVRWRLGLRRKLYPRLLVELRPSVNKIRVDSQKGGRSGVRISHAPARSWRWNRTLKSPRSCYCQMRGRGGRRGLWAGRDQVQALVIRGIEKSPCGPNVVMGLKLKERVAISAGTEASQPKRWAHDGRDPTSEMGRGPDQGEHLVIWETEEIRKKREKAILSATDKALAEEAMRGESFDHSRVLGEINEVGPGMEGNGCWDLVEFTKDRNLARGWSGIQR
ncbi:hypothetical protein CK203_052490 [Vitis vinifera]|uniref:DUF4283 domain-containing protein n=1 Tax=Vitis vinifera TaxID=29760 RepID=A0A438HCA9_VITVI|nr:hypothetical protein CK203_052490 [Vitis vinifera]